MPPLTARQHDVLAYLRQQAEDGHGHAPSLDEVCAALGLKSRGSLHKHVQALVEAGLVHRQGGRKRGLHLTPAAREDAGTLPVLGRIAAGLPIEALGGDRRLAVPDWLRGAGDCYLLEVRGDSMADAGIVDGDIVVIEHRSHARNGEIVVALIDGEAATLKRLEQRPGIVILHPANPDHAAQTYPSDRVTIQGVLRGRMRAY